MADYPPFMNSYGLISKILDRIKEAKTPPKFTLDFLGTEIGYSSGSAKPFIGFAKRLGLLASDGTPTDRYKRFRNSATSGAAMADAIKEGYDALYRKNEYAHNLEKEKIEGFLTEITGLESGNATVRAIRQSFEALKAYADFDASPADKKPTVEHDKPPPKRRKRTEDDGEHEFDLALSYTINLVLPKTDDVAVFNAIFKSLRENLLRK